VEELTCSLANCDTEVLGTGVILADTFGIDFDWDSGRFDTYIGNMDGKKTEWVVLHPNCFLALFNELTRQSQNTVLMWAVGQVAEIREALYS
jgi:hypothetical protein